MWDFFQIALDTGIQLVAARETSEREVSVGLAGKGVFHPYSTGQNSVTESHTDLQGRLGYNVAVFLEGERNGLGQ